MWNFSASFPRSICISMMWWVCVIWKFVLARRIVAFQIAITFHSNAFMSVTLQSKSSVEWNLEGFFKSRRMSRSMMALDNSFFQFYWKNFNHRNSSFFQFFCVWCKSQGLYSIKNWYFCEFRTLFSMMNFKSLLYLKLKLSCN